MGSDPHRSERVGPRAARGVGLGVVVGTVAGAAIGAIVGLLVFRPGSGGMWGSIVAGLVLGVLGGALWGALVSLGPPAPEDDPLPREAEREWTVEDEPAPAPDRGGRERPGSTPPR